MRLSPYRSRGEIDSHGQARGTKKTRLSRLAASKKSILRARRARGGGSGGLAAGGGDASPRDSNEIHKQI